MKSYPIEFRFDEIGLREVKTLYEQGYKFAEFVVRHPETGDRRVVIVPNVDLETYGHTQQGKVQEACTERVTPERKRRRKESPTPKVSPSEGDCSNAIPQGM